MCKLNINHVQTTKFELFYSMVLRVATRLPTRTQKSTPSISPIHSVPSKHLHFHQVFTISNRRRERGRENFMISVENQPQKNIQINLTTQLSGSSKSQMSVSSSTFCLFYKNLEMPCFSIGSVIAGSGSFFSE